MSLNDFKPDVLAIFEKINSMEHPRTFFVKDIPLIVLPGVFSPVYFPESIFFARELSKIVKKKTLFEVGTGTGIISLFCAQKGAKIVATDINSAAVQNAQLNFNHIVLPVVREEDPCILH